MEKETTALRDCFSKLYALPFNSIYPLRKHIISRDKGLHWEVFYLIWWNLMTWLILLTVAWWIWHLTKTRAFGVITYLNYSLCFSKDWKLPQNLSHRQRSCCCHYFRWRSRTKGPQTQSRSHNHLMLPEVEGTDAVNRLHCPRPLAIMMHDHPHILMSLRLTWDNKASRRNWNHRGANLLMPMRNASTRCSHPSGLYILSLLLRQISKEWFDSIKLREHKAFICISRLKLSVKPDTIVFWQNISF